MIAEARIGGFQIFGNKIRVQQEFTRRRAVAVDIQSRPVKIILCFSEEMNACHEAADLSQEQLVVQIRRATAAAWIDGEAKISELIERAAIVNQRCNNRDLFFCELD